MASILVVDDFRPFRRFICTTLKEARFRFIEQASDGLEAVRKAAELQPDLILLDIGLPQLNGIEAAKQISKVAPLSKILFVSAETSPDVVRGALSVGGLGYVDKSSISADLLPAIKSVLAGQQFVSQHAEVGQLTEDTTAQVADCHEVHFYSGDAALIARASGFLAASLKTGSPAVVIATEAHREGLTAELKQNAIDVDAAIQQGTYIALDAAQQLSGIMVNGMPDGARFFKGFGNLIKTASESTNSEYPRVTIFGECVGLLCADGHTNAAIRFEKLANLFYKTQNVVVLCAYPVSAFDAHKRKHAFESICKEHSAVHVQ